MCAFRPQNKWLPFDLLNVSPISIPSNNGFEADSEGSDNESAVTSQTPIVKRSAHTTPTKQPQTAATSAGSVPMIGQPSDSRVDNDDDVSVAAAAADGAIAARPMGIAADATVAIEADVPDCNGNPSCCQQSTTKANVKPLPKQCTAGVVPVNVHPKQQQPAQHSGTKRQRMPDVSKFNRSNRKSKNCATFYFKHSDTDGETRDWSTPASESINATSEEDEWVYKNQETPNGGPAPTNNNDDTSDNETANMMKASDMTNANASPADVRTHSTTPSSTIDGIVLQVHVLIGSLAHGPPAKFTTKSIAVGRTATGSKWMPGGGSPRQSRCSQRNGAPNDVVHHIDRD